MQKSKCIIRSVNPFADQPATKNYDHEQQGDSGPEANFVVLRPLPKAVHRVDPSARSGEKKFHLHFSVVWIGSRSTFVLCTALLTDRLSVTLRCTRTCHSHSY